MKWIAAATTLLRGLLVVPLLLALPVQAQNAKPFTNEQLEQMTAQVALYPDSLLAQPDDVVNAVQRLRQKAQAAGNLKSNEQIKVSTEAPEAAPPPTAVRQSTTPPQVIVIEPAQPSVVYVPMYNPTVAATKAITAYDPDASWTKAIPGK